MSDVIIFTAPLPPVALRRNHGKGSFTAAARALYSAELYAQALLTGWRPPAPAERLSGGLHVWVRWFQCGKGDADNALASAKVILDSLGCAPRLAGKNMTYLGVYTDDSQISRICAERIQVKTEAEQRVEIRISQEDTHGSPES